MLRYFNLQAWVAAEKGTKTCLSLRIPSSIVASAALSILLLSAGAAGAQQIHLWEHAMLNGFEYKKSDRSSDGGYGFGVDSVMSTLSEASTNTALTSDISHYSFWPEELGALHAGPALSARTLPHCGEFHFFPLIPQFPVVPGGTVPEPSTLLLGLAGMVGALGVGRRRRN